MHLRRGSGTSPLPLFRHGDSMQKDAATQDAVKTTCDACFHRFHPFQDRLERHHLLKALCGRDAAPIESAAPGSTGFHGRRSLVFSENRLTESDRVYCKRKQKNSGHSRKIRLNPPV